MIIPTRGRDRLRSTLATTCIAGFLVALLALVGASAASADGDPAQTATSKLGASDTPGKAIPGHYIITLEPGENPRAVAAIAKVTPTFVYESALNGFAAQLNEGQLKALRQNRAVQAIEADQEVTGETHYSSQQLDSSGQPWGIDRIDQRTGLSRTFTWWTSGAGTGVRAYVIDSGIATAHPDFGGRAQNLYDAFGGNMQDCNGHGTHVAGTIGGYTHGVAKSVLLRGVRVLDCNGGGSVAGLIAGVDFVRQNAIKPAVANISISAGFSSALNTAVYNLVNSGVFVAVAAGNGDKNGNPLDACTTSPASANGTLTVASANWYDTKASDSNYGKCVDLYAPGVLIKSTWLNGMTNTISGTSMATPHVTGVAALIKSDYGDQTSASISNSILNVATTNVVYSNVSGTPNRLLYMSGW